MLTFYGFNVMAELILGLSKRADNLEPEPEDLIVIKSEFCIALQAPTEPLEIRQARYQVSAGIERDDHDDDGGGSGAGAGDGCGCDDVFPA